MSKADTYNLLNIDIFAIEGATALNTSDIHSLLLFLYNKGSENPLVTFTYSEINWINRWKLKSLLEALDALGIITLIQKPTKYKPVVVQLKSNEEIQTILHKNKKIDLVKYQNKLLTKDDLKHIVGCDRLGTHVDIKQIPSWLRNINTQTWDKNKFLVILKIISYFNSDYKIKSATLNKYMGDKTKSFNNVVTFLYTHIPSNKKETIFRQFENSVNIKGTFVELVNTYLRSITKT